MGKPVWIGNTKRKKKITLTSDARETHMQVIGGSRRGKSKFLENMIRHDILNRHGLCLIDPHGSLFDAVVKWCATHNIHKNRRIHIINPALDGWTVGFNPLRIDNTREPTRRVDGVVDAFSQVWSGEDLAQKPLLKKCLRIIFYTLASRNLTLAEADVLASAKDPHHIRAFLTDNIDNPVVDAVWREFADYRVHEHAVAFGSTTSRLIEFLMSPRIRDIIGTQVNALDLKRCMDEGDIVLVNLADQGVLSADNARLIGTLITNDLFSLARSRKESVAKKHPFYLYIDECYDFLTSDIEKMLDQTAKFGLHVVLAHHRLGQLREKGEGIYNGVMAGTHTKVVFGGLPDEDAEIMAREIFRTEFDMNRPKEALNKMTVVDYQPYWLESYGTSEVDLHTDSSFENMVEGVSEAVAQKMSVNDVEYGGTTVTTSEGSATGQGTGSAHTTGTVTTSNKHQTLMPVLEEQPTQLWTLDELIHEAIVKLRELPKQSAIVKRPNKNTVRIKPRTIQEGTARRRTIENFTQATLERSEFAMLRHDASTIVNDRRKELVLAADQYRLAPPDEEDDDGLQEMPA